VNDSSLPVMPISVCQPKVGVNADQAGGVLGPFEIAGGPVHALGDP
jgi:hypothetical protein